MQTVWNEDTEREEVVTPPNWCEYVVTDWTGSVVEECDGAALDGSRFCEDHWTPERHGAS